MIREIIALLFLAACGEAAVDSVAGATVAASSSSGAGTGGSGGSDAAGGMGELGGGGSLPSEPTRYPSAALLSPLTEHVAIRLRDIASGKSRDERVFMKVGASGTVSTHLVYCFAGASQPQYGLNLDGREALLPTIEYFRQGTAAGTTPFDRPTLAAKVGVSAVWAITGSPTPLEKEIAAINPRFAVVNYGTNDMSLGTTHRSAMWPFHQNLTLLIEQLEAQGIVPIVTGLNPRSDSAAAARWVPTYDAVTRAIAERKQLPYINLYRGSVDLPNKGLVSDGVHGNSHYVNGKAQPCVFTATGLQYNYNVRNLLTIQMLDVAKRVVIDGAAAPDAIPAGWKGSGSASDPIIIDQLPFTHSASTLASPHSVIGSYPGCKAAQDESGPELVYRLELKAPTPVRMAVFDGAGVDVDIHLLGAKPTGDDCIDRDDRIIERTLPAGVSHVVVDTFTSSAGPQSGEYSLVVVACEPGDPDCT
jgi:hypothetical protein